MKQSRTTLHAWLAASLLALGASAVQAQPQFKPQYIDAPVVTKPLPAGGIKPQPVRGDLKIENFSVNPEKCSCEEKFRAVKMDGIIVAGPVHVEVKYDSNDRNATLLEAEVALSYVDRSGNQRRTVRKRVRLYPSGNRSRATVTFNPPRLISYRQGITASIRAVGRGFTDTNPRNNSLKQTGRKYCKVILK